MSRPDSVRIPAAVIAARPSPNEVAFHDLMAEQIRHAPWLGLSVLLHGLVLALLWLLLPPDARKPETRQVALALDEAQHVEQPEPQQEPETRPEVTEVTPELVDAQFDESIEQNTVDAQFAADVKESAFPSDGHNAALGMGGGAGGPYGDRGLKGRGPRGGRAPLAAIDGGLDWLARHQDEDGKWDVDGFMKHDTAGEPCDGPGNGVHDVGVTGLALLAFLGDGSTLRGGRWQDNIKSGVRWLREQQDPNTGLFGSQASHDFVYDHAIAAYAMCEAYGLSQYQLLKPVAQKGLNYLESHRNPYSVWRYQPRDNDNDTSVTGWCIMAYESGAFFGLDVNQNALKLCETWLDQVTDAIGRCGYTRIGEPSSRHPGDHGTRFPVDKGEAMTAVGLFCRYFMGQNPKEKPVMNAAADLILGKPPIWDSKAGTIDEYYWYYATYALFQHGGRHWLEWSKRLDTAVVKTQRQDGNYKGSWDPIGVWGQDGGRVYTTAMLVLTLEAYFRYSKLVR